MTNLKSILNGASIFRLIFLTLALPVFLLAQNLKIDKVEFRDNAKISSNDLRKIIKIQKGDVFNNKLLRIDETILTNYYQKMGFLEVWIDPKVERAGNKIHVIFNIKEGIRYRFNKINFTGLTLLSEEEATHFFNVDSNKIYQQSKIENGLNKLEDFYYDNGKPYVEISDEIIKTDSLITINIDVHENETVSITEIDYEGLKLSQQFLVRRELLIKKGDIYSRKEIENSQKNVYSTGLFEHVSTELKPILGNKKEVRLIFTLREKKARWIGARVGLAYEQETVYGGTFDFTLEGGHRNLFGTGRSISATVLPSLSYDFTANKIINPKNQFSLTYVEPWIGYTRTPGILKIGYYTVRPLNSANYNYFSSSFQVKHEYDNFWQASGTIAVNQVNILQKDSLDQTFFSYTNGHLPFA